MITYSCMTHEIHVNVTTTTSFFGAPFSLFGRARCFFGTTGVGAIPTRAPQSLELVNELHSQQSSSLPQCPELLVEQRVLRLLAR